MRAVVLVGGRGTRLQPLTDRVPKPALRLCGRPFISYMLAWLRGHGVEDVVLACGFEPEALQRAIGEGDDGQRLRFVVEPDARGTAGAIRFAVEAVPELLEDRFLVLNGDVLTDLDIGALAAEHERARTDATIALVRVDDAAGYGLVTQDDDGMVAEFAEKPEPLAARSGGTVNAGIYLLEPSILERIPAQGAVSIERDVFPSLVKSGLGAAVLDGYWLDIGTPERFLRASWDILSGRVVTPDAGRQPAGSEVLIEQGAEIAGELVPPCVVGPMCRVGAGAVVERSVLFEGCVVGDGATVRGSILGAGVEVEEGGALDGRVIGDGELVSV